MSTAKPRILLFDIETMANLSWVWGRYEQNVVAVERDWHIITFACKWLGDKKTQVFSLPDFPGYVPGTDNDAQLVHVLWELFDEADVIIAHNGNDFDIKKVNARFAKWGMKPPSPYKTVDTKLVAKRYFKFDSNRLNDLGTYFGLGEKLDTGGFDLWIGCHRGDTDAWKKMCKYNKQDVVLLEKVYLRMLPYMTNHPNMNLLLETTHSCPNCGGNNMQRRGMQHTRTTSCQRYQCSDCGAWSSGNKIAR